MEEAEQKQLLARVLSVLAIVLMTSGILVKTVPLESKRPADPEHAKFSHAGLQDVEARLWQDPFGAMRHLQGSTPSARCAEALKDTAHYPYTLSARIRRVSTLNNITVLPVLMQGGSYFEHGESRRRARYAVVTALINGGWVPSDEDKMGYVWTFENCIEGAWARHIPEILPYEWFDKEPKQPSDQSDASTPLQPQRVLVLWVDEDAVSRGPLRGVEQLAALLGNPQTLCHPLPPDEKRGAPGIARARQDLAVKLHEGNACYTNDESTPDVSAQTRATARPHAQREVPWRDMRVIGPFTSTPLPRMVRELAFRKHASPHQDSDPVPTRFYSATATMELGPTEFARAIERAKVRGDTPQSTDSMQATPDEISDLQNRFAQRMVRLTTTDEKLAKAFVEELALRLGDHMPWPRLVESRPERQLLCDDTIVIVGEHDTSYARFFRQAFANILHERCGRDDTVVQVGYLRGLDGVLPTDTRAPTPSAPQQAASDRTDTCPPQKINTMGSFPNHLHSPFAA
jgi:hypothetical protein